MAGPVELDPAAAARALDVAHVLDDAQDGHPHHAGHVDGLADDHPDQVLRRADDYDALDGQRLEDGQRHVAGSRGHVDQQVIDLSPEGVLEELLEGPHEHGAAPQDGVGLVLDDEVGAHDLDAARRLDRVDVSAVRAQRMRAGESEHLGDGGSRDVGVEDGDPVAPAPEPVREDAADQRLADAALAGDYAHDVPDA